MRKKEFLKRAAAVVMSVLMILSVVLPTVYADELESAESAVETVVEEAEETEISEEAEIVSEIQEEIQEEIKEEIPEDAEAAVEEAPAAEDIQGIPEGISEDIQEAAEEEEPAAVFSAIAADSVLPEEELRVMDFSSRRLLVAGEIIDPENVLSEYEGVYLLQYPDAETAMFAFSYYYGKAAFVEIDSVIAVAEGNGEEGAVATDEMSEIENPLSELAQAVAANPGTHEGTTIALIDTGVNGNANVIEAVSMIGDDVNDLNGHGTKMAELIVNENPDAKIISIKALGANGTGDVSAVYAAIQYAIEKEVDIINLSMTAPKKSENAAIKTIVQEAAAKGIKVVGSAGNQGRNAAYYIPGSIEEALIIGACDENAVLKADSNRGETVDYYVVADSTSEAAAIYSGLLSKGLGEADDVRVFSIASETGEIIPDEEPEEEEEEIVYSTSYKDYIQGSVNPALSGADKFEEADVLLVKPTFADAAILKGAATIDNAIDEGAVFAGENIPVILYDLDDASAYYVGYADLLNGASAITDYEFAYTNMKGEVLNDCVFDAASGLVYVPKKYKVENHNGTEGGLMNVTLQTLYVVNGEQNIPVNTFVEFDVFGNSINGVDAEEIRNALPENGTYSYTALNPYLYVQIPAGVASYINIDVLANGYAYENWKYDEATGTIMIATRVFGIRNIQVVISESAAFHAQGGTAYSYEDAPKSSDSKIMFSQLPAVGTAFPINYVENYVNATGTIHPTMNGYNAYDPSWGTPVTEIPQGTQTLYNLIVNGGSYDSVVGGLIKMDDTIEYRVKLRAGTYSANGITLQLGGDVDFDVCCVHVANPAMTPEQAAQVNMVNTYSTTGQMRVMKITGNDQSGTILLGVTCAPLRTTPDYGFGPAYQTCVAFVKLAYEVEPQNGKAYVVKSSSIPAMTDNNPCYDLNGAQYTLYTSPACTKVATDVNGNNAVFTVNSSGNSNTIEIKADTYYAKETKAGKGYILDAAVYPITVTADQTATLRVSDIPRSDPITLVLQKKDSESGAAMGAATLAGAQFTVKYYKNLNASGTPERTWVFATDSAGKIKLDEDHLVSGDALYKDGDIAVIPAGTITIQETNSPVGYSIDEEVYVVHFTVQADNTVAPDIEQIVVDGDFGLDITVNEQILRADLRFRKVDVDGTPMPGIPFLIELLDEDGKVTESHVIVTDEKGIVDTSARSKAEGVNSLDQYVSVGRFTPDSALDSSVNIWFGDAESAVDGRGSLVYGNYRISEIKCEANKIHDLLWQVMFTPEEMENLSEIFVDGRVFDLAGIFIDLEVHPTSNFFDKESGTKTATIAKEATLVDTVTYNNLKTYNNYKVTTNVYHIDHDGNDPVLVGSHEVEFKPRKIDSSETSNGTVDNEVVVDTEALDGGALYAVDIISVQHDDYWIEIVRHNENLTEPNQKIAVPWMSTTARDGDTEDHVGTAKEDTELIDTVIYEDLADGVTYLFEGTLRTKDGEIVKDAEGNDCVVTQKVTASSAVKRNIKTEDGLIVPLSGQFDMPAFTFDATGLMGEDVVVTEVMYDFETEVKVLEHYDLEDEDQTVEFPGVQTKAEDARTEDNVGSVGELTIVDTVSLTNLVVGEEYTVTGILMDKETGEPLLDDDGNEITSVSDKFVAEEAEMEIEMSFTASVEVLAGKTIVVFEDLLHKDIIVAYHHDIDDEEQSEHYPEIGTTAIVDETEDHVGMAKEELVITDTVHYKNLLTDGREYTVTGTLMNKATEEPLLIDGEEVTATKTFVPEETEGDVEITFTIDASELKGTTLVAFETVTYKGVEVAVHADITDEGQTVYIPEIRTNAHDAETEIDHSMNTEEVTLIDTVTYTDLLPGKEYVVKGTLMNKKTGEPVLDEEGNEITAETIFTPDYSMGQVDVVFTFNGTLLESDPVVVFESVTYKGIEVAVHADITDADQSDYIPEIGTTAIAEDTEDHITCADEEVVIIDTVEYKGLKPETEYEVKGILMDKATGKPIEVDGKPVESSAKFTTPEAEEGEVRIDGSVEVEFKFDGSALGGTTTVVFETLYTEGRKVAVHADIEDEGQTIHIPDAKTTATDTATESHTAHKAEEVEIQDVVKYTNLLPGKTYTVTGTLMVKETGKELLDEDGKPITATTEFEAEKADGEVVLKFTVDTTKLVGKSIVVFEDVQYEGITVVLHADLEDEDQTVTVPEIGTTAKDKASGSKTMTVDTITELAIIDTVAYKGLTPGAEYTVKGEIMDKSTGKPFKDVKAEITFKPETPDGTVDLEFKFTYDIMAETDLVVFETVYDAKGNLIAEHKDLEDENQTVKVVIPKGSADANSPKFNPQILGLSAAYAGLYAAGVLFAGLLGMYIVLLLRRRRMNAAAASEEKDEE